MVISWDVFSRWKFACVGAGNSETAAAATDAAAARSERPLRQGESTHSETHSSQHQG